MSISFQSLTRDNVIGANCYLLQLGDYRILLDTGMHPKEEGYDALPQYELLPDNSIDAIFITHAHLDHSGSLPVALENQKNATVYMTPPTGELVENLLHNAVNVMQKKREELGIDAYPFYYHRQLDKLIDTWQYRSYRKPFQLNDDIKVTFYNAGHILGSCSILIEYDGKRIFYSGDIQTIDQCLIEKAELPPVNIDYLIVETTRGAVATDPKYDRDKEIARFTKSIQQTIQRGGSVLVPVFAIGKTQEVLTMIYDAKKAEQLAAKTPVYIGGLSTKMSIIFDRYALSQKKYRKRRGFTLLDKFGIDAKANNKNKRRKVITYQKKAIFALSSGMMTEKTISNGFAYDFIGNPKNKVLFVGYTDSESPAAILKAAKRKTSITLDEEKGTVFFDCDIEVFDFSGHANRDDVLAYIKQLQPAKTLLVHGDKEASQWFEQQLTDVNDAFLPVPGKSYQLD